MDEKTEELRDIFMEVADSETLTEPQENARGCLTDTEADEDKIRTIIEQMQDQYTFEASLDVQTLVAIIRSYYQGYTDQEIAERLEGVQDVDEVRTARYDLHLISDEDRDAPFDITHLRDLLDSGQSTDEIADSLETSPALVEEYAHLVQIEEERRLVGDKFRAEFDRLVGENGVTDQLTEAIQETGLDEATEGLETDTGF